MHPTAAPRFTSGSRAKVTPTARASMLVARAMSSMVRKPKEASAQLSSLEKDSLIMLPPMKASSTKATQWSTAVM